MLAAIDSRSRSMFHTFAIMVHFLMRKPVSTPRGQRYPFDLLLFNELLFKSSDAPTYYGPCSSKVNNLYAFRRIEFDATTEIIYLYRFNNKLHMYIHGNMCLHLLDLFSPTNYNGISLSFLNINLLNLDNGCLTTLCTKVTHYCIV